MTKWITDEYRRDFVKEAIRTGNIRLNLGCGMQRFHKPDHINIDISPECRPDILMDLETDKLPFDDDTCKGAMADNVLEHFADIMPFLNEMHRVMAPGCEFYFRVPAVDKFEYDGIPLHGGVDQLGMHPAIVVKMWGAFRDPTHKTFFCEGTMDYFNHSHQTYKNYGKSYGFKPWNVVCRTYHNTSNGLFFYDVVMAPVKQV